jgi:hypothetical protein
MGSGRGGHMSAALQANATLQINTQPCSGHTSIAGKTAGEDAEDLLTTFPKYASKNDQARRQM